MPQMIRAILSRHNRHIIEHLWGNVRNFVILPHVTPSEALMQLFGLLTPESFRIVASSTTTGIVESFLPLD